MHFVIRTSQLRSTANVQSRCLPVSGGVEKLRGDEVMSRTAGSADCLLDCLRTAQLEQFAGNFATRGVTDCTKLAMLGRHQFATYGVTSPADVRRLTRLITVIRDLRAGERDAESKPDTTWHKTLSVPGDLTVERCQQKQFRRAVSNRRATADAQRRVTDTRTTCQ